MDGCRPDPVGHVADLAELDAFFVPQRDLLVGPAQDKVLACRIERYRARVEAELFIVANRLECLAPLY